ncbi:hypothetical protein [Microbacterium sp. SL75]|nr:hypothetical protein [Microbacterium sp. SL75]WAC70102.1 hypothetical protein OVA17_05255 [Microbacterium sp. SL75]
MLVTVGVAAVRLVIRDTVFASGLAVKTTSPPGETATERGLTPRGMLTTLGVAAVRFVIRDTVWSSKLAVYAAAPSVDTATDNGPLPTGTLVTCAALAVVGTVNTSTPTSTPAANDRPHLNFTDIPFDLSSEPIDCGD